MPKTLSIVIVSYNTRKLTAQTITSVFQNQGNLDLEIIVVDNNSTDGSVDALQKEFGKRIRLISLSENGGFSKGNNVGIKASLGEYILLLNSDTVVQPHALERLVDALETHAQFGIVSSRLQYPDQSFQPQGGELPNLLTVGAWALWPFPGIVPGIAPYQNPLDPKDETLPIVLWGWVGGTAMLIRKKMIDQIGLLDEKIFMYAEDVEYCLRAHRANWRIGIVPKASIIHYGSASGSSSTAKIGEVRGLLYVFSIHYGFLQELCLRIVFLVGTLLRFLLFGILKGDANARKLYSTILSVIIS